MYQSYRTLEDGTTEEIIYTITLEDGTTLHNLTVNGDNFISQEEITQETFDGKLGTVVISDGEYEEVHKNMAIVLIQLMSDGYYFALRDLTNDEITKAKLRSDVDYIAMMSDIEI